MSNLNYAFIEEEIVVATELAKPYLVQGPTKHDGSMSRRVESALDTQFANGSMPA